MKGLVLVRFIKEPTREGHQKCVKFSGIGIATGVFEALVVPVDKKGRIYIGKVSVDGDEYGFCALVQKLNEQHYYNTGINREWIPVVPVPVGRIPFSLIPPHKINEIIINTYSSNRTKGKGKGPVVDKGKEEETFVDVELNSYPFVGGGDLYSLFPPLFPVRRSDLMFASFWEIPENGIFLPERYKRHTKSRPPQPVLDTVAAGVLFGSSVVVPRIGFFDVFSRIMEY